MASQGGRCASSSIWMGSSMIRLSERNQHPERTARSCTCRLPTLLMSGWVFTARGVFFQVIDLELCHAYKCLLRGQIIGKWTGHVVGVTFPPKSVHHQVHVLQMRVVPEFRGEQFIQFGKRLLKFWRIVTRFTEIEVGLVFLGIVANVDDGYFVM